MVNPVYFYYPNLVGYFRVVMLFWSLRVAFSNPFQAFACYALSMGLDAIDGMVARACGQVSSFGAQLDMLSDRMSTTCLFVILAVKYPKYWLYSAFFIVLDITSHWLHMMSKHQAGNKSHKTAVNWYLRMYYTFPYFMLVLCVGQELFLGVWFLKSTLHDNERLKWAYHLLFDTPIYYVLLILFLMKSLANLIQLLEAAQYYAAKDLEESKRKK